MDFDNDKAVCLNREDKSRKGSIDIHIQVLCDFINSHPDYYTTSSCAGRIVLQSLGNNRGSADWLFVSHEPVEESRFIQVLEELKSNDEGGEVWFIMESMILHVACRNLEKAQELVDFARSRGFKRSGIQATSKRFIVEVVGSERIETLISSQGKFIDIDHARVLVNSANKKLLTNFEKLKGLEVFFHTH